MQWEPKSYEKGHLKEFLKELVSVTQASCSRQKQHPAALKEGSPIFFLHSLSKHFEHDKATERCVVKDPPPLTQSTAPPYSCVMKEIEKNVLELESHFHPHY